MFVGLMVVYRYNERAGPRQYDYRHQPIASGGEPHRSSAWSSVPNVARKEYLADSEDEEYEPSDFEGTP